MKGVFALLLALPLGAVRSEPLIVEYEGLIDGVFNHPDYAVGDRIAGRLFIDTLLAGADTNADPDFGRWGRPRSEEYGPNFVTRFRPPDPSGLSTDVVLVVNNALLGGARPGLDTYLVSDDAYWSRAAELSITAHLYGLLDNADIHQSFEVTSADVDEEGESLFGRIQNSIDEGARFLISRLTVKPARCFAGS